MRWRLLKNVDSTQIDITDNEVLKDQSQNYRIPERRSQINNEQAYKNKQAKALESGRSERSFFSLNCESTPQANY